MATWNAFQQTSPSASADNPRGPPFIQPVKCNTEILKLQPFYARKLFYFHIQNGSRNYSIGVVIDRIKGICHNEKNDSGELVSRLRGSHLTSTLKPDADNAAVGSKEYLLDCGEVSFGYLSAFVPLHRRRAHLWKERTSAGHADHRTALHRHQSTVWRKKYAEQNP